VFQSSKGVDDQSEIVFVEADSQRIDRKVAAILVVFQSALLHFGLAAVIAVTFPAGAHKFNFHTLVAQHSGAESPENNYFRDRIQFGSQGFRQPDAVAHTYNVYIFGRAPQQSVADIAADDIYRHVQFAGALTNSFKHFPLVGLYGEEHFSISYTNNASFE
jgi:hypothetical protein